MTNYTVACISKDDQHSIQLRAVFAFNNNTGLHARYGSNAKDIKSLADLGPIADLKQANNRLI